MKTQTIEEMQAMILALGTDSVFGCKTRQYIELNWSEISNEIDAIIFIDLDNIHILNETLGYAEVDKMVKNSLSHFRHDDILVSRYYSGDEIIFMINNGNKVIGCAERIQKVLAENSLSGTIGISTEIKDTLVNSVQPATILVQNAKKNNQRGTINL